MKLHLPSKLRHAVLACMTAMVGITSTCATGSFVAGVLATQAQAADTLWNATKWQDYKSENVTVGSGDRLIIGGSVNSNGAVDQPKEADWPSGEKFGKAFQFGNVTVEEGGQLYILTHRDKSQMKTLIGAITLRGEAPTDGAEDKAALLIDDGGYSFTAPGEGITPITIDGYVTIEMFYGNLPQQSFTNLTSTSNTDELHFRSRNLEGRKVVYSLNYDKGLGGGGYAGTIVVETPISDGLTIDPCEYVSLSLTNQFGFSTSTRFIVERQGALRLSAGGLTVGHVTLESTGILANYAGGSQVKQNILNIWSDSVADLYSPNGSTQWNLSALHGSGSLRMLTEGESYNPSIYVLNNENPDFTGMLYNSVNLELGVNRTSNYGIYQNYVQIGHPDALKNASLDLSGDPGASNEWSILTLESTDAYIGSFTGSSDVLVAAGKAPTDGSAESPSTRVRPVSNAATKTLHFGAKNTSASDVDRFYGVVLKNVNLSKEGAGTQLIANIEEDPSRYIYVKEGTLEIGSLGDFYRIVVSNGARAEIGFATSSKANTWGHNNEFIYYDLVGNDIDLSDSSKIQGNVVLTDKIYSRRYEGDGTGNGGPIVVTYLDADTYTKDTLTIYGADVSVFNPNNGSDAKLSKIDRITLASGGTLVSAAPSHFPMLLTDPGIEISSDIVLKGTGNLHTYGDLFKRADTGEWDLSAFDTEYSGKIYAATEDTDAYLVKSGDGKVTLSGDMSEFNGYLDISDGTMVLSGTHGKFKNMNELIVSSFDKAVLELKDDVVVTTEEFQFNRHGLLGLNINQEATIEAGSILNITAANSKSLIDGASGESAVKNSYSTAPMLMSHSGHGHLYIYGTLNMERMSCISFLAATGDKTIDVYDGGVFNAKGVWAQTNAKVDGDRMYVTIHDGATLNIGEDGIGHANMTGGGVVGAPDANALALIFKTGSTLGVINDCDNGWETQRVILLDNETLTVNTQGFVIDEASTANGSAKTIRMEVRDGGIIKEGVGTLAFNPGTNLTQIKINDGYVGLNIKEDPDGEPVTNYNIMLGAVGTYGNGSLLVDLKTPVAVNPGEIPTANQPHITMTGLLSDKLNLTVRQTEAMDPSSDTIYTYAVLATGAPSADKVNLIALVDDGVDAKYEQLGGYGRVTLTTTDVISYGSDSLLTWKDNGVSDFWANSTQKNWKDDKYDSRRFTNNSDVQFTGAGETITVLDNVYTGNMTIASSGYEFTGAGSIFGQYVNEPSETNPAHKMVVKDGVKVTFSSTGTVFFQGGVELGKDAVLRLEYLSDDPEPQNASWQAPISGEQGILEVATGGIRTNVLTGTMGDSIGTVRLDNKTTIKIDEKSEEEAGKLAAAKKVEVLDGSRFFIASGKTQELLDAGDTLYLAGAGKVDELEGSQAALTVTPYVETLEDHTVNDKKYKFVHTYYNTNASIKADTELTADATIYVGNDFYWKHRMDGDTLHQNESNHSFLTLGGGYCSNGHTLYKMGYGALTIKGVDSSAQKGDISVKEGSLTFAFDNKSIANGDAPTAMENKLITKNVTVNFGGYTALKGGLVVDGVDVTTTLVARNGLELDSAISLADDQILLVAGSAINANVANPDMVGVLQVGNNTNLYANHSMALANATVFGHTYGSSMLYLGANGDTYYAAGLERNISVRSAEPGEMKTLVVNGLKVYDCWGKLGTDVSLVKDGKGAQRFTSAPGYIFEAGYNGNLTVNEGLLEFRDTPATYNTLSITSDDAELCFGDAETQPGTYIPLTLRVGTNDATDGSKQTLLITESGATLNANLSPVAGGHIVLGTEDDVWTKTDGLKLYGRRMTLDTADKADLTINLSGFMEVGEDVDLFSEIGTLMIDGERVVRNTELGMLEDYFNCDDINLAEAKLVYTDVGTLRITLVNKTDGQYYEYNGGTSGVWNTTDAVWAKKDDTEGRYKYNGGAAYFTNAAAPTTVTLEEDISAREMAVKNGDYTFELAEGNDLFIDSQFYEKEDAKVTFLLSSENTTDANGNPVANGAKLTVEGGMGTLSNTVIRNADNSTANTLVLGGTTTLTDNAVIDGVDLMLDGKNSKLNLTDTKSSEVLSLRGDGTVLAKDGMLTVTGSKAGTFDGSLLGAPGAAAGANTLTIGVDGAQALQTYKNVTTDKSWNLVNNGALDFTPTEESQLYSMTLTNGSKTTLTLNTDQQQMLGLTALAVEEGADITLNSTGNAPIMSDEATPGYSHKVLGSFEDDGSLEIDGDAININRGFGTAFLMVDKEAPITLKSVYNQETGHYDLVLVAKVDDSNQFAPYAVGETNAEAGAEMLWTQEAMTYINAEPNGDLARTFNEIATMVTSTAPNGEQIREALASVAGSSTAVLGSAFSADVERQLKAIRNRTTTMGVGQCEVNENMPYYNAWINAEGNHRELSSDGLAAGYTHDSWGGTVGFDVDVSPSVTWGLALTAMYGDIESEGADKAEGDFDTMYLSAFARYAKNAWVHTFVATVGRADVTLNRTVNVGSTRYEAEGETDGMAFGFMYEVGRVYALSEDGSACWQPMFNVALRKSSISGYDEEGSDAGLSVGDQDFTTLTFGVGARLQTVMGENLYNRASIFEARALLKFDAGDTEAETETALLNGNGVAQTVEGAEVGAFGVELGAGITIPVGAEAGAVFIDASAELRSGYTNINGTLGYRVNF